MATVQQEREADERVKREIGPDYQIINLSGYWVIGHRPTGNERLAKHQAGGFGRVSPEPLRRSLDKAIADVKAVLQ